MSLECYRSRGKNSYYYEGKRVSKKIASSLSPKLPKCVPKTKANEIKNLKKQLKQVLTHREEYKTTSADLDSRLKACSIVKGEYDRLVDMINSANSSVDVMNRVCLTQDLKKQIDREYRELRETLESTTRSYDEKVEQLLKIVEKNKLDIEAYQSEVLSVNEENNNLREALKENANIIAGLGQQINQLQNEKAALLEELNIRERIIYDKNGEIEERMRIIGRLDNENTQLKNNINNLNDENENLKDDFEDLKEKATRYYNELNDALEENGALSQRVVDAETTIEDYTQKMTSMQREIDTMENLLIQSENTIEKYTQKMSSMQGEIDRMETLLIQSENTIEKYTQKMTSMQGEIDTMENLLIQSENTIKDKEFQISETGRMFGKLSDELRKSNKENNVLKQRVIDDAKIIENNTNDILKAKSDLATMTKDYEDEIDLVTTTKVERNKFQKEAEQCESDKLVLQEEINNLIISAQNLRNDLQEEKNRCLDEVKRAITVSEGAISKREARKYEKELSDLNVRLTLADEALDELRQAGTLGGQKLPAKAVKKAIKKLNQAGK